MKKLNPQVVILLIFWIPVVLLLSIRIYLHAYKKSIETIPVVIEGYVLNYPYDKDGLQEFKLKGYRIKSSLYPKIHFGEHVKLTEYKTGKYDIIYFPRIEKTRQRRPSVLATLDRVRDYVIYRIQKNMPEPHAALLLGTIIGYKEDYPQDTLSSLKSAGVMHVIVVSGYNVSLVFGFVFMMFKKLGRIKLFTLSTFSVLFYMAIVGFDPPVIRAVVMGIIGLYSLIAGRQQLAIYTLFVSAILMIFINPDYLYNVSFEMSFIAMLSIIAYSSLHLKLRPFLQAVIVVIFVNLALIPVFLYYFGTFSFLSIPVNVLVLWVIPFLTIGGLLFVIFPNYLLKIVLLILSNYFFFITRTVGNLNVGLINNKASPIQVFFYYVAVFSVYKMIYFLVRKQNEN